MGLMRSLRIGSTIICLFGGCVAVIGAGCGSSKSEESDSKQRPAKPKVDKRPRVEGKWRLVFTPRDSDENSDDREEDRVTWTITPLCAAGPCSFRFTSSSRLKGKVEFDDAIGDYQRRYTAKVPCTNETTGEVVDKAAYTTRGSQSFQPVASVIASNGTDYVTEMAGTDTQRFTLKKALVGSCGGASTEHIDVRAVRIDKPAGKPGSAVGE